MNSRQGSKSAPVEKRTNSIGWRHKGTVMVQGTNRTGGCVGNCDCDTKKAAHSRRCSRMVYAADLES